VGSTRGPAAPAVVFGLHRWSGLASWVGLLWR
jgi:hypothetical protein